MAQVHGKVHPHSGLMFESVCDSLMKLAVRGSEQLGLQALNIEERVSGLIHELLDNADAHSGNRAVRSSCGHCAERLG